MGGRLLNHGITSRSRSAHERIFSGSPLNLESIHRAAGPALSISDATHQNSHGSSPNGRENGEGGIRTPATVTRRPHFECGSFNHSDTSPRDARLSAHLPDLARLQVSSPSDRRSANTAAVENTSRSIRQLNPRSPPWKNTRACDRRTGRSAPDVPARCADTPPSMACWPGPPLRRSHPILDT